MKSHGILFSAPMVRALLRGDKSQTRRIVTWHNSTMDGKRSRKAFEALDWSMARAMGDVFIVADSGGVARAVRPIWQPGDEMWVRESIRKIRSRSGEYIYRADIPTDVVSHFVWRSSLFMPRCASRITLPILSVRAQFLQDVSEEDAKAEGIQQNDLGQWLPAYPSAAGYTKARMAFESLWNSINGDRAPWDSNPPVWAITAGEKK